MPELAGRLRRLVTSWPADLLLAAIVVGWSLAYLGLIAAPQDRRWPVLAYVLPYAAALAARRRWAVAAAMVACAGLLAARLLGVAHVVSGLLAAPFFWTPFLIAYCLGTGAGLVAGLACAALFAAGLELTSSDGINPIFVMITIGPWLVGRVVLSRRKMIEQLRARNAELRAEQELFARESVRYERARIARELHDIVAHCLSVMVVQASAGQRVADAGGDGMAEALESVAEAAAQAQAEIGRLVELLGGEPPSGTPPGLPMVSELVRRAGATGLAVTCRFLVGGDHLPPAASEAAYRVVQEALTNALKHAPGAPVDITVSGCDGEVEVDIVNAPPRQLPSGLERSGGGFGLGGMRDRIAACGGRLTSGPTPAGGWRVSALLPADPTDSSAPCGHSPARRLRPHGRLANSRVSLVAKTALSGRMKQGPPHV
ncbi:MAG: sensor histidine kinase [Streptosporangiaceae bacterium]